MLLLFLTVIYFCVVYVGQKPTRACVVLLFKMRTINKTYLFLSYLYFIKSNRCNMKLTEASDRLFRYMY